MKIKTPKLRFNNPLNEDKLSEIVNLLEFEAGDIIIDIGGGEGRLLLDLVRKSEAKGILIDINEKLIESCKRESESLVERGKLKLIAQDAKTYMQELEPESVDCFICLGASYIFDNYEGLLRTIIPYLKPKGFAVIGEQYWKKQPAKEYLEILEADENECGYHHENIKLPEKLGMAYLYSNIASIDDWDKFEGTYFLEEELKALEYKEQKQKEFLENLRKFRNAQFEFGRSTMGFGLYLFKKVES